jgi:carboxyl-terminal processing protease
MISMLLLGFGVGFGLGRWSQTAQAALPFSIGQQGVAGRPTNSRAALAPSFALFWEALDLVYRDYYGDVPAPQEMTYNAIRGVVNHLGDPNTSFLTPQEADVFRTTMEGSFEGIGARVEWDDTHNTLRILEPFENQPAWQAGLRRGDLVLQIDGNSIVGSSLSEAIQQIRGPKGTKVLLTIRRAGAGEPFDVEITRDRIESPTISTDTLGAKQEIAYVRLYSFNQNAGQLVRQAVEKAMAKQPRALIFDLRGNSGGLLHQAVLVASVFLQDQVVLLERFSNGKTETYKSEGRALTQDIPILVLVNEGTASASEIVAGALQDHQRATLLGAKTYGKGSVQLPHTLTDGSIMRVTIARWYTPKDRTIDGAGLLPDLAVELTEEQRKTGADPQLDAAVHHLEEQLQK